MIESVDRLADRAWAEQLHRAVVERFMEAGLNRRNAVVAESLLAPTFTDHGGFLGEPVVAGRCAALLDQLQVAFPEGRYALEDLIADGDKVVLRVSFHGTHRGGFRGHAPTGRAVSLAGIHIFRCGGRCILEHWAMENHQDLDALLRPAPTPGPGPGVRIW